MACCITSDSSAVNEGGTVYFTLSTTNVKAGSTFAYTLAGVSAADVAGGLLTGIATTDASGKAIIAVTLLNDSLTDGDETLTISAAGKTASVSVKDTSVAAPLPVASTDAFSAAHSAAVAAQADGAKAAAAVTAAATAKADADAKASAAKTKADLTDATALKASSDTAAATAAKAVADNATAQALVITSQTNFENAIASGVVADVNNTNALLAINKSKADTAAKAVTSTAAAAKTALDAANSAAADDQAAADAATAATAARTALDKAIAAASPLTAAATAAAAADATAAAAYKAAALATANTADDAAGNAAPGMAAALGTQAAADAKVVSDAAAALAAEAKVIADAATEKANVATADAALAKYTAAASQYDTDLAAYNAADAAAATAISAVSSAATATTAYDKSVTEQSAAATLVASAAAKSDAAKALKAAADATKATTDDAAATTAVTAASSNTTSAAKAKADADTQVATQKAKISDYDAKTFTLTKGLDNLVGTAGDDTFSGSRDKEASNDLNTASNIDTVDGGAGTGDKFKLSSTLDLATADLPVISNIEILEITGAKSVVLDTTGISGLTTLTINKAGTGTDTTVTPNTTIYSKFTASSTTSVNVSGSTDKIEVIGGNNVTVSDSAVNKPITVSTGAASGNAAGAISVTDSKQGTGVISVDGGTSVDIIATTDKAAANATTGAITVGANKVASGAVTVTQNTTNDGSTAFTAGNVTVTGGTTITINANLTNTAIAGGSANNITAGTYKATASTATTAVTITQNAVANDFTGATTGKTKESAVVTFGALAKGEKVAISYAASSGYGTELTFTASKDLTAAEVAAAFASLTSADKQAPGGIVSNGTFSGTLDTGWVSSSATGSSVTFTATTTGAKASDITVTTNTAVTAEAAKFTSVVTQGSDGTTVSDVDVTEGYGAVLVDDNTTAASITTITLNGYSAATLGGTNSLNKLATLNLTKGAGTTAVTSTVTTLALNLDGMKAASAVTFGSSLATLNLTTSGSTSDVDFTASGLKTVNITAGAKLDVSGSTFTTAETLNISGAGDVVLGSISSAKTVSAASASGKISATVDGTKATVTTGSGADTITVSTADTLKAIDLGAGDDTLHLSASTANIPTAAVNGGDGTDTVKMTFASAQALAANTGFKAAISNFERLTISDTATLTSADVTVDLEKFGFSYVTLAGGTDDSGATAANKLVLDKMASGGTLVFNDGQSNTGAQASTQVNVTNAATGTSDVLNIMISNDASKDVKTVIANNVETLNIKATDVFTDSNRDSIDDSNAIHLITASGDKVTSVVVTGDDLKLDTDSTVLTSVDASAILGGIEYTADGLAAGMTVLGGAGVDKLTSDGENDVLKGNAGNDVFTVKDLAQVYGGAGADTFNFLVNTNLTKVSTIRDAELGDVIVLKDVSAIVTKFWGAGAQFNVNTTTDVAGKVNAALAQTGESEATWFNHNGNTYIVIDADDSSNLPAGSTDTYVAGQDIVIEIVGVFNLANATYNSTSGTLELPAIS